VSDTQLCMDALLTRGLSEYRKIRDELHSTHSIVNSWFGDYMASYAVPNTVQLAAGFRCDPIRLADDRIAIIKRSQKLISIFQSESLDHLYNAIRIGFSVCSDVEERLLSEKNAFLQKHKSINPRLAGDDEYIKTVRPYENAEQYHFAIDTLHDKMESLVEHVYKALSDSVLHRGTGIRRRLTLGAIKLLIKTGLPIIKVGDQHIEVKDVNLSVLGAEVAIVRGDLVSRYKTLDEALLTIRGY